MGAMDHIHLSPQGFVFDHHTGLSFSTNGTGAFILQRIIDGRERQEVLIALVEDFDVTPDQAAADLDEFLHLLRRHRLLPRDSHGGSA